MEEALDDLPKSLEAMYADVLETKIPEEYREEARVMLMWLAYSYRPLRLRELAFVASLPEQNVLHICTSSLVSLDEDDVKFDHFSVKEFLVSERLLASKASSFYVPPTLAHLQIAGTCISTLFDPNLVKIIERYIQREPNLLLNFNITWPEEWWKLDTDEDDIHTIIPLLGYSRHWHFHVQEADSMSARSAQSNKPSLISESENLRDHIHKLFCIENNLSFIYWAQVVDVWDGIIYLPLSPLYYASFLNLPDSVRRLLKTRSNSREAIGAVLTLRNKPQERMTPLHIAGVRGNLEIVSLFLDSGMRMAQSGFEHMIGNNQRDGVTVMTSILKTQPDLSITDDAVKAAASNRRTKELIKYFLNNGYLSSQARLLLVLKYWREGYHEASLGQLKALVKALVKHGEDIGCTGQEFFNAVAQGHESRSGSDSLHELVLERYEPLSLSLDISECIASDTVGGVEMLRCLCEKYKDISFSQDQLAAAAAEEGVHGMQVVDIILEYDKTLRISQLVIQAVLGYEVFFVLVYHNKSLEITWEVLESIMCRHEAFDVWQYQHQEPTRIVKVLMDHDNCGFRLPAEKQPIMQAYIKMHNHIGSSKDCKINCSKEMLQAAARWKPDAIEYLQSHARPNVIFRKYALQDLPIPRRSNTF